MRLAGYTQKNRCAVTAICRAGEDSARGLHEGPVGQSGLQHDRYGDGPERRGRGR